MEWLEDILSGIDRELARLGTDPTDVANSTKRRMAYAARWPERAQMEAHSEAAAGRGGKLNTMRAEYAAIRAALPVERPLAEAKEEAKGIVDSAAEAARLRYITPGAAQAMVYQQKAAEARMLQAGGAGPFPHLAAEVGITAKLGGGLAISEAEVAEVVLATEAQWLLVSAAIETVRLTAKRAITLAENEAEVDAALAAIEWPAP